MIALVGLIAALFGGSEAAPGDWELIDGDNAGPVLMRRVSSGDDFSETMRLVLESEQQELLRVLYRNEIDCENNIMHRVAATVYDAETGQLLLETDQRISTKSVNRGSSLGKEIAWFCGERLIESRMTIGNDLAETLFDQWAPPLSGSTDWLPISRDMNGT